MNYLAIAQYMAASALLTIGVIHLLIWLRVRMEINHLLFGLTAAAAAANALAETVMYRADSIEAMSTALRWYVTTSGCWAIAAVCFIASYARVGRIGRFLAFAIIFVCGVALVINLFSPASFLYTELTGLREIRLPWGETIRLAIGVDNPLRLITELSWLAIIGIVADGCYQFWRRRQYFRALFFGSTVFVFMACFWTHAFLVDTGRLDSPYLSTYGFLAVVGLMSYELAGEVMRISELKSELVEKENELETIVAAERARIAGDLHDSVTQTLFSTAAIADALPEVWKRSPDEALRGLDSLKRLTKSALAEMRTLLLELHPAALLKKNLGELLRQLATATAGRTRVPVEVKVDGDRRFPDEIQVTLYRIAQEALNNATQHAQANQIWLTLIVQQQNTTLTIRDNGRGFDPKELAMAGLGLGIMRRRVQTIGGRLEIESKSRVGTTVTVHWTGPPGKNGDDEL